MHPARQPRGRRALLHAALAGLLATIVFALAQCTMVEDQLTNVDPFKSQAAACVKGCRDDFKKAIKDEQQLHKENLRECGVRGDGQDDVRAGDLARGRAGGAGVGAGRGSEIFRFGDLGFVEGGDKEDDRGQIDDEDDATEQDCDPNDDLDEGGDPDCIRRENQRHCEALKTITDQLRQCLQNCHHQGGGSGG